MTRRPIVSYNDEKQNRFGSLYHTIVRIEKKTPIVSYNDEKQNRFGSLYHTIGRIEKKTPIVSYNGENQNHFGSLYHTIGRNETTSVHCLRQADRVRVRKAAPDNPPRNHPLGRGALG